MALPTFNYQNYIASYPELADFGNQQRVTDIYNFEAGEIGAFALNIFQNTDQQLYWLQVVLSHIIFCQWNDVSGRPNSSGQGGENISEEYQASEWEKEWTSSPYGFRVLRLLRNYSLGGYYIPQGNPPYDSDAMSGNYSLYF